MKTDCKLAWTYWLHSIFMGPQPNCGRPALLLGNNCRTTCHCSQECSTRFRLNTHAYKKLFLDTWFLVVHSMTLYSYNNLQWLVKGYRRPRHCFQIIVTSRNNQVSHSTTATTHRMPLDIYPEAELWECYWVRDYLLSYRPWLFVEVDDLRDLR